MKNRIEEIIDFVGGGILGAYDLDLDKLLSPHVDQLAEIAEETGDEDAMGEFIEPILISAAKDYKCCDTKQAIGIIKDSTSLEVANVAYDMHLFCTPVEGLFLEELATRLKVSKVIKGVEGTVEDLKDEFRKMLVSQLGSEETID